MALPSPSICRSLLVRTAGGTDIDERPLVLLVDDDADILVSLRLHLRADGYDVVTAGTVAEGKRLLREQLPHVAVVDLVLPDGNGLEVAHELHQFAAVPVILLTAVDDEDSKVQGLQGVADDYVTKPFSARELSARLVSLLRRAWPAGHPTSATLPLHNGVEVDFRRRHIVAAGQLVHLTPTESRLLWLLVSNAGQVLTTQTLLARVWPASERSSAILWEYIRRLREKLGENPSAPQYIITERDLGYRFQRG